MTSESDCESTGRLLSELMNTDPPESVESRMREKLCALRSRLESQTDATSRREAGIQQNTSRRWLSGWGSLASVCAVAILVAFSWFSINSSPALAQIAEKVAAKTWLHAKGTGLNGQPAEMWFSAEKGVLGCRMGKSFIFIDQIKGTMDVFGEPAQADSIQRVALEHIPQKGIRAARHCFLALLSGNLRSAFDSNDTQVLEHNEKSIHVGDRELIEHRFVVGKQGQKQPMMESLLQVDPVTGLPVFWKSQLNGQVLCDYQVSYPKLGPLTIMALGVAETTPIVDQSPSGEFRNVLLSTNTFRHRFDDYHAIVIDSSSSNRAENGTWHHIWRKGNRWRVDRGHRMFHKDEVPPPGADPETWWLRKATVMKSYPYAIWDGKRMWSFEAKMPRPFEFDPVDPHAPRIESLTVTSSTPMNSEQAQSNSSVRLPEFYGYEPLDRGTWFGYRAEVRTDTLNDQPMTVVDILKTFDKSPNRISPDRYWLDPQRTGMIVRRERFLTSNLVLPVNSSEVVLAARSPQGLWYPLTVRDIGSSVSLEDNSRGDWYDRYYLEFGTHIPDELFHAESVDLKNFWTPEQ